MSIVLAFLAGVVTMIVVAAWFALRQERKDAKSRWDGPRRPDGRDG